MENENNMTANGGSGRMSLWDNLAKLEKIFPKMIAVQTLSFYVTSHGFGVLSDLRIRQSDLVDLIALLPPTVERLELDPKGTHDTFPLNHKLCHQLAVRMPRIKSLRLRIGHMCQDMLGEKNEYPHLQDIVVNLLFPSLISGAQSCRAGQHDLQHSTPGSLRRALVRRMLEIKKTSQYVAKMLGRDSIRARREMGA